MPQSKSSLYCTAAAISGDAANALQSPSAAYYVDASACPRSASDRRSFNGETVQCEAIPPDALAAILVSAIEQRIGRVAYARVLEAEPDIRAQLNSHLAGLLDDIGGAP